MQYYFFHLMSWPYLPADFDAELRLRLGLAAQHAFTTPSRAHDLYREYIDTLAFADELGFDGICVNEHHQNAYGLMPSPNLIAAALTQRTKRCKIAVIGNALPLYNPPLRVAEEFAMLDVMSGGRLVAGMVIGGGPEYFSYQINPTHARERFREALDLIVKAWTTPGPFLWNSKHYFFRYVNPWPRPLQQPHPPIWIPGAGSLETIEFVAQRRYAYMGIPYFHIDVSSASSTSSARPARRPATRPRRSRWAGACRSTSPRPTRQAREEFEPHFWYFVKNLLKNIGLAPPGYTSARSALAILKNRGTFLAEQEDLGRHRGGRLRHRRQPGRRCGRSSTTTARSSASASC